MWEKCAGHVAKEHKRKDACHGNSTWHTWHDRRVSQCHVPQIKVSTSPWWWQVGRTQRTVNMSIYQVDSHIMVHVVPATSRSSYLTLKWQQNKTSLPLSLLPLLASLSVWFSSLSSDGCHAFVQTSTNCLALQPNVISLSPPHSHTSAQKKEVGISGLDVSTSVCQCHAEITETLLNMVVQLIHIWHTVTLVTSVLLNSGTLRWSRKMYISEGNLCIFQ